MWCFVEKAEFSIKGVSRKKLKEQKESTITWGRGGWKKKKNTWISNVEVNKVLAVLSTAVLQHLQSLWLQSQGLFPKEIKALYCTIWQHEHIANMHWLVSAEERKFWKNHQSTTILNKQTTWCCQRTCTEMTASESKFLQSQHSAYCVKSKHDQFCLFEAVMWIREQPIIKCRHWVNHCPCPALKERTSCSSLLWALHPCSAHALTPCVGNLCHSCTEMGRQQVKSQLFWH